MHSPWLLPLLSCCWLLPLAAQSPVEPDAPSAPAVVAEPAPRERLGLRYVTGEGAHPTKHLLDLHLPKADAASGKPPIVMWVHGGAWRSGDRSLYAKLARTFADQGIACAAISYRLSPEVTHPGHVEDCARALRWIVDHADEYGYDRERLFLCGHSAGAHLVALLATDPRYLEANEVPRRSIRGVIPISGPFDVRADLALLEQAFGKDAEVRRDASPLVHVAEGQPPFLVLWADGDMKGLPLSGRTFAAALQHARVDVESAEIEDRNHVTIVSRFGQRDDRTTELVFAFIRKHAANAPAAAGSERTEGGEQAK